jgi:anti-anti-sigma factor
MGVDTLEIRVTGVGPSLYIALTGELDIYTGESLAPLHERLQAGGVSEVDLDLLHVRYIDSTGLMHLVRLYRTARRQLVSLRVHVQEDSIVERVLRLIGAGDLFPIISEPPADHAAPPNPQPTPPPPAGQNPAVPPPSQPPPTSPGSEAAG